MTKKDFIIQLENLINIEFAEIIKGKPEGKQYLSYFDFQAITTKVRNVFINHISEVPPQIEAACELAEVVITPTLQGKKDKLKAIVGITGGTAGIAMVVGGIGAALQWGAGVIAAVGAFFAGASIAGPIGWISGGVAVTAIAGYFAFSKDDAVNTERAVKALKSSLSEAVEIIWDEYGAKLEKIEH